jgi:hypothetical protein
MNSFLRAHLGRVAKQSTRVLAIAAGRSMPFYYVGEFPRSGGSWIAHLLSDYLQIPFPKHYLLPMACKSVLHHHWPYHKKFEKPVYVVRDGRDVAVSMMFYAYRRFRHEHYYAKRFPSLFDMNDHNHAEVFSRFLHEWFAHPVGCRQNWPEHVEQWTRPDNVIVVKYEDFSDNAASALRDMLIRLGIDDPDERLIELTVEKYSFEQQTKRKKGEADALSNKRKGIIGDWKNYFSSDAAELFHNKAGDVLLKLGYETASDWHQKLEL